MDSQTQVDSKSALLQQLRIDRSAETQRLPGRSLVRWAAGFACASLAVAGAIAVLVTSNSNAIPVRSVIAATVESEGAVAAGGGPVLEASGYVVAVRQANVSAKGIYKVVQVFVQQGDRVVQDQIIAKLDDSNVRAALEQSHAQVKQLKAALAAARLAAADATPSFVRAKAQRAEGLISEEAFESAKASYDSTQSATQVAEQNLLAGEAGALINQRFEEDTVIRAPFAGIVTVRNAQPGEIVSPQFSGGGGIAAIVDMDSLEVDVDVSENYISRVRPKQPASIRLDAYPDWKIPAEVIAIIPTADRAKATVQVRVGFKHRDSRILPQMGARVAFLGDDSPAGNATSAKTGRVVVVPFEAVQVAGSAGVVYVIEGRNVAKRAVRLGSRVGAGLSILSGLEPGSIVAVGDFGKLHDGARVRINQ
jgi:RND family efflux transporter MFP subunit